MYETLRNIMKDDMNLFIQPFIFQIDAIIKKKYNDPFNYIESEISVINGFSNFKSKDALLVRIVQVYGLLNNYHNYVSYQIGAQGLSSNKDFKTNHIYSLTISVTHDVVDIIKKKGFGLFYSIEQVNEIVGRGAIRQYEKYIIEDNEFELSSDHITILKNIFSSKDASSVDDYMLKLFAFSNDENLWE